MILKILIIFALLIFKCESSDDLCSSNCQKCDEETIECRDLNQPDLNLLKNSPSTIELITFTGNNLTQINQTIFSNSMPMLELLDLSNNQIVTIQNSNVFENLPNLFELILDKNQLDLDTDEHFSMLKSISTSLERLSLNKAFTESKTIDYSRSAQIDYEIHSLLKQSQLRNLFELRLKENSLVSFNIKPDLSSDDFNDNDYTDILCLLPKLKILYLEKNSIEKFDFDLTCLNENKTSALEWLHLDSNRINTITFEQIQKFQVLSEFNSYFRVHLLNNPFKCDCGLLDFYKWLSRNESNEIVYNKMGLKCSHEDSFKSTLNQPIIHSNLASFCRGLNTEAVVQQETHYLKPKIYFPRRNRTRSSTSKPKTTNSLSLNKLVLFLMCVLVLSTAIILLTKNQCFKVLRNKRKNMNRYSHLDEEVYSSMDGAGAGALNNGRINFRRSDEEVGGMKRYWSRMSDVKRQLTNKFPSWHKSPNGEISTLPYEGFDTEFSDGKSKSVENSRLDSATAKLMTKMRKLKTKQAASNDESDKEELTIMDAAVNNIQLKQQNKNEEDEYKHFSPILFVRTP